MKLLTNGDIVLEYPDIYGDILLYGQSIMDYDPISVRYNPDRGWGQVLVAKESPNTDVNYWIDGQPQNFTLRGPIVVIYHPAESGTHGHISENPTLVVN